MNDNSWSLGTLVALPIGVITTVLLLAFSLWLFSRSKQQTYTYNDERGMLLVTGVGGLVAALIAVVITAWGMYPFKGEYHQYRPVSGVVAKVDSRLVNASGDSTETKFVIRFEGSDQQYGCDDTRCASVGVGDNLALSCKRAWQYTGTDGYDCRFVSLTAA